VILNRNLLLIGAGVGLVLVVGAALAARYALPAVGQAVNPLNPENIFNQGASGVVTVLTGREETLGGWLAELFDPATRELARVLGAPLATAVKNPLDSGAGAFL